MKTGDTYNRSGFLAFIFSMAFSLCFFVYVALVHPGVDLKEVPEEQGGGAEQTVAGGAAQAVDVSKVEKPWISSDDLIAHGKQVYTTNCAVCHGPGGAGDGPAGKALVPPPRNLIEGKWKVGGDSIALYKTLKDGIAGTSMASFAHIPKLDRWALVHFMRSITENKVSDNDSELETFATGAE